MLVAVTGRKQTCVPCLPLLAIIFRSGPPFVTSIYDTCVGVHPCVVRPRTSCLHSPCKTGRSCGIARGIITPRHHGALTRQWVACLALR